MIGAGLGGVGRLVASVLGVEAGLTAVARIRIDPMLEEGDGDPARGTIAMALNVILFDDLLSRVPSAEAYVADVTAAGGRIAFDHGALRTICFGDGPTGALPAGEAAFRRILGPLGYTVAGLYPLPKLRMTGRAYRHRDLPEAIPQFFVSELHVDAFDPPFGDAARRVFGGSRDPLGADAVALLAHLERAGAAPFALAAAGLPDLVAAFGRHHPVPALADYQALLAQSAEAAWIATEGNAFNHATDRVEDVEGLAERQRAIGRRVKDAVEISGSGRVRQTAFLADAVARPFIDGEGAVATRQVPGSFYEFISRSIDPATGTLDLGFDSGNAQGIFAMTQAV